MIRPLSRSPRARAGITLTEILISLFIMAIGLISLATLFPIGLVRLRAAARMSRSAYLVESAAAELEARNLLNKNSFLNIFGSGAFYATSTTAGYDPWLIDTDAYGNAPGAGVVANFGPGLPVAYDPLWRAETGVYLNSALFSGSALEARFASGINTIRNDPNPGKASSLPSAHGLPRLTNFNPLLYVNATAKITAVTSTFWQQLIVEDTFVSPEDMVLNDPNITTANGPLSPILPDLNVDPNNPNSISRDFRFTWMFTGSQTDATNGGVFDGNVVIFENRPFAIDNNGNVAGETVVEAIFGPSQNIFSPAGGNGYGIGASQTVLLRWPASQPDPEVKVGNWLADVTYERNQAESITRQGNEVVAGNGSPFFPIYRYQRCYWYQIVKKTDVIPDTLGDVTNYRSMTVWVSTPLQAQTLLNTSGQPVNVNAALVSPFVANVYPRTIYSR